ncbi:hypothetical protein ACFQX7_09415 [Luedemannella flava]
MLRSLWSARGAPRLIAGSAAAGAGLAAIVWLAPNGYADATSPSCPTPVINSGTLTPPMPGKLVNAGTSTTTITGRTEGACGWSADSSLHLWAPNPSWFQAGSPAELGDNPVQVSRVTVTRMRTAARPPRPTRRPCPRPATPGSGCGTGSRTRRPTWASA